MQQRLYYATKMPHARTETRPSFPLVYETVNKYQVNVHGSVGLQETVSLFTFFSEVMSLHTSLSELTHFLFNFYLLRGCTILVHVLFTLFSHFLPFQIVTSLRH